MAYESVSITPGSGKDVAVDTVAGKEVQIVKLDAGEDGVSVPVVAGQATKAGSLPVTLASDQGAIPVSDNASTLSVDDGAGSLTVDSAQLPAALGQTTMANSLPVALASNQSAVPVVDGGGSLTVDGTVGISGAVPVTDNAGSLTVDGTVAATQSGTWNIGTVTAVTGLTNALPAGNNNIGDVDVASLPTGASAAQVQGTVAHDGAAANNPVLNGGYAINAEPAAVAHGDVARVLTDLVGKLLVLPYANPEAFVAGKTADITGTSDTAVIAAQGAGVRLYITQIVVVNSHATVGTWVNVKDGATAIYTGYAAPAGGGFALTLNVPLRLTANTALNVACETTGSNVRASASGYKGA